MARAAARQQASAKIDATSANTVDGGHGAAARPARGQALHRVRRRSPDRPRAPDPALARRMRRRGVLRISVPLPPPRLRSRRARPGALPGARLAATAGARRQARRADRGAAKNQRTTPCSVGHRVRGLAHVGFTPVLTVLAKLVSARTVASHAVRGVVSPAAETLAACERCQPGLLASYEPSGTVLATQQRAHERPWHEQ